MFFWWREERERGVWRGPSGTVESKFLPNLLSSRANKIFFVGVADFLRCRGYGVCTVCVCRRKWKKKRRKKIWTPYALVKKKIKFCVCVFEVETLKEGKGRGQFIFIIIIFIISFGGERGEDEGRGADYLLLFFFLNFFLSRPPRCPFLWLFFFLFNGICRLMRAGHLHCHNQSVQMNRKLAQQTHEHVWCKHGREWTLRAELVQGLRTCDQ